MAEKGSTKDDIYVAVTPDGSSIMATTARVVASKWVNERYKVIILENKRKA